MAPRLGMKAKDNAKLSAYFRSLSRKLPVVVDEAIYATAEDMQAMYESTASTWTDQPVFEIVKIGKGYKVMTLDEIWNMLEHGTRPHRIEPVNGTALSFQSQYQAKTTAGMIAAGGGGAFGDYVFALGVDHPGTKPRNWHELIYNKIQPQVVRNVRQALREGVEAVGL